MYWFLLVIGLGLPLNWVQGRDGITIDKMDCKGYPPLGVGMYCSCTVAPDDPFDTTLSLGLNVTRECPTVFVRLTNYVKLKKGPFKQSGFKLTLDACAISAGGTHPIMKTFLGPDVYRQFDKILHNCPYGPEEVSVHNFSIDGKQRGMFGLKREGLYRTEYEFTCGQNLRIFSLSFIGKRGLHINGTD